LPYDVAITRGENWRFLLVGDPDVRAQIGPIYRRCITILWEGFYAERVAAAAADPDSDESKTFAKARRSAQWLADNFEIYPLLMFSFVQHDPTGGSIYPATWSAMLAARAEGVGASLTSVLLFENDAVLEVLGVPAGEGWLMSSCATFGYPTGRWGVADRRPLPRCCLVRHGSSLFVLRSDCASAERIGRRGRRCTLVPCQKNRA